MPTFTISVNNKVLGTYVVKKTVISIGRSRTNTISIASKAVSRNHVRIESTADGWTIADLGSLNGTYVNDIRINSAFLSDGDRITVGAYAISFSPEPLQAAAPGETHVAAVQAAMAEGTDTDVRLDGAVTAETATSKDQTDVADAGADAGADASVPPPPKTTSIPAPPVVEEVSGIDEVGPSEDSVRGMTQAVPVTPKRPVDPSSLQLGDKIKAAICENPLADDAWLRTRLGESDFGKEKISRQDLLALLKQMDLDSNLKRYRYFMHS
jgi:pSer/pThr/pTyr-binding forkhead associated (FHA) protein